MPSKKLLHTVDLFSGIGGFSYALRSVAKTVAYCDIDHACRQVLTNNMKNGNIERAPIFEDVAQLQASSIKKVCNKVDLVCGGFPCQDVAVSGKHAGVHGGRTGLYMHIIRLVRELPSVKYVFLENVANIFNLGLEEVVLSLENLGFSCAYGVFQANEKEVGSFHARRRCYIFACRATKLACIPQCHGDIFRPWQREPRVCDRLVRRKTKTDRVLNMQRYAMLGNSVVPQCVAHAWNVLSGYLSGNQTDGCRAPSSKKLLGKVFIRRPGVDPIQCIRTVRLNFRSRPVLLPDGVVRLAWATPQRAFNNPYFTKSSEDGIVTGKRVRGFANLINQIFFEKDTQNTFTPIQPRQLYKFYDANPKFIEWLMGYPSDWTRLHPASAESHTCLHRNHHLLKSQS